MSTAAGICTHLAFWDVFTDDLLAATGTGIGAGAGTGTDTGTGIQPGPVEGCKPTLNFGWRTGRWRFEFGHKLSIA